MREAVFWAEGGLLAMRNLGSDKQLKIYALVVAGGQGQRFNAERPKQYWTLHGKTILRHSIDTLMQHAKITGVQVVIHPDHHHWYQSAVDGLDLLPVVMGASERQGSVFNGLQALQAYQPDIVLIHDGARPFISSDLIHAVIDGTKSHQACIPVLPLVDTVKQCNGGNINRTIPRTYLYGAQTPQGFHYPLIWEAHQRFQGRKDFTDDASLLESLGISIAICPGEMNNFKITTQEDYIRGKNKAMDVRVGNGFDVHGFMEGPGLWLCGLYLPSGIALKGHSDADVALHALTDAILGAIGAQDIGHHFPPSDPQWRGAASRHFLQHAINLMAEKGGRLNHVDITVIGEQPRLSPHRADMIKSLSSLLNMDEDRISVKATTTERLGFTGRKEGLAAMATATVVFEG
jgi:2-C-methyl-D-erythritol 4-phosphate cytidylyltransferase/2-C-methyl-D-erythritol 2,4-cyclodiphosphate synthase